VKFNHQLPSRAPSTKIAVKKKKETKNKKETKI
jgi:hypothetical protein